VSGPAETIGSWELIRQTLRANYGRLQEVRYSQCLTDRWNSGPGVGGFSVMIPGNPEADRGKCAVSRDVAVCSPTKTPRTPRGQ
jgi:hypothetical protein